jgi:Ca-activated chloride channel homolog
MTVRRVGLLAAIGLGVAMLEAWSGASPGQEPDMGRKLPALPAQPVVTDPAPSQAAASFESGTMLSVEGRLGHARLRAEQPNETLLYVGVQPTSAAVSSTPPGLNLAIVIDRSGSMKGKRLANALAAARGMIGRLRDGDVVSVVSYAKTTEIVLAPTELDDQSRGRASAALETVVAQGGTCISCGIETGMELLARRKGLVDRMLLLSDGEATDGVRDLEGFRQIAARCRGMGASISAIGVDVEYNERVMSVLALESNGRHHFVDEPVDLTRAFDAELETLAQRVADEASLEIELEPGVELGQVFDRAHRREGSRLIVPLGGFSAGEQKTALVSLRLPAGARGERSIASVRLAFTQLASGDTASASGKLGLVLVGPDEAVSELDPVVATRAERAETTAVLRDANQLFHSGRVDEARSRLATRLALVDARGTLARQEASERGPELKADLEAQALALGEAEKNFRQPALAKATHAGAPRPKTAPRKSRAQVKVNAARADAFAF